jgi:hypothetical protein
MDFLSGHKEVNNDSDEGDEGEGKALSNFVTVSSAIKKKISLSDKLASMRNELLPCGVFNLTRFLAIDLDSVSEPNSILR